MKAEVIFVLLCFSSTKGIMGLIKAVVYVRRVKNKKKNMSHTL